MSMLSWFDVAMASGLWITGVVLFRQPAAALTRQLDGATRRSPWRADPAAFLSTLAAAALVGIGLLLVALSLLVGQVIPPNG